MRHLLITLATLACCVSAKAVNGTMAGQGTGSNPYQIADKTDLNTLKTRVANSNLNQGVYYKLVADIDDVDFCIGTDKTHGFQGYFDGAGHTVTMNINTTSNYCGLFGTVTGGTVEHVIVAGSVTTTGTNVAGVAGYVGSSGILRDCVNKANVNGASAVGGLAGAIENGAVWDCVNKGNVTSTNSSGPVYTGGIVGWLYGGSTVGNSAVAAGVAISNSANNYEGLAAIVGYAMGGSTNPSNIKNCVTYSLINISTTLIQTYQNTCSHVLGKVNATSSYVVVENCFWWSDVNSVVNTWTKNGVGYGNTSENTSVSKISGFNGAGEFYEYTIGYDFVDEALNGYATAHSNTSWDNYIEADDKAWMEYLPAYYQVTIEQQDGAVTTCNTLRAKAGTAMSLTYTPNEAQYCVLRWEGSQFDNETSSLTIAANGTFTMPDNNVSITPHVAEHHQSVGATCTENGELERYYCTVCDKNYESQSEDSEMADYRVEALGHDLSAVTGYSATCTEDGITSHQLCSRCGNTFLTDADNTPIDDVVIPATGHKITHYASFTGVAGNVFPDIYKCSNSCNAICSDEELTQEVTTNDCLAYFVGQGTAESPYEISCQNDLVAISRLCKVFGHPFCSATSTYSYTYNRVQFVMTQDVEIVDKFEGISKSFGGAIDGQHHAIILNATSDNMTRSLFSAGYGLLNYWVAYGAEFRRINFKGSVNIENTLGTDAFYPFDNVRKAIIDDCHSYISVNIRNTSGNSVSVAGIANEVQDNTVISNCTNHGDITISASGNVTIGGIVNSMYGSVIKNCCNTGNLRHPCIPSYYSADGMKYIGGIVCKSFSTSQIDNCYNSGDLFAQTNTNTNCYVGGIYASPNKNVTVANCYNAGTYVTQTKYGSGLSGTFSCEPITTASNVSNCYYLAGEESTEHQGATQVTLTDGRIITADGDDVVALLNGTRDENTEWAYGDGHQPVFVWQSYDMTGDGDITIADVPYMNDVLRGLRTSNRGCLYPDGTRTANQTMEIVNRILENTEADGE